MLLLHTIDRVRYLVHIPLGLLNRRIPVAFPLPSIYIALKLGVLALLLFNVLAELADIELLEGIVDKLQPTCFSRSVFFGTLLPKVAPSPKAADPSGLVEVTHLRRL